MKVICLKSNPNSYSCNAYLILGDWNRIKDVNTLVDVGVDDFILKEIEAVSTGLGKKPVDQVILTHSHFDHCSGVKHIKERFFCKVYCYSQLPTVDKVLQDKEYIRCGDLNFEVIHTPGHSSDSICLYCAEQETLFSGDTPLNIKTSGGSYTEGYIRSLERLSERPISKVYPGHGLPICGKVNDMIKNSLRNVRASLIVADSK